MEELGYKYCECLNSRVLDLFLTALDTYNVQIYQHESGPRTRNRPFARVGR